MANADVAAHIQEEEIYMLSLPNNSCFDLSYLDGKELDGYTKQRR